MFSGIIEEVGTVIELLDSEDGRTLKIGAKTVTEDVVQGASISVNGACLTVVEFQPDWFSVQATFETLRRTTLGQLGQDGKVNLERALKVSDRLGGHLVSGHVDAIGQISAIHDEGFSRVFTFNVEAALSPFFVDKGSVAVDGISLTVVEPELTSDQLRFKVALIPHTLNVTTLGQLKSGQQVNVETDMVARYIARLALPYLGQNLNKEHPTFPFAL